MAVATEVLQMQRVNSKLFSLLHRFSLGGGAGAVRFAVSVRSSSSFAFSSGSFGWIRLQYFHVHCYFGGVEPSRTWHFGA